MREEARGVPKEVPMDWAEVKNGREDCLAVQWEESPETGRNTGVVENRAVGLPRGMGRSG